MASSGLEPETCGTERQSASHSTIQNPKISDEAEIKSGIETDPSFLDRGPDHAACYGCEPVNVSMFREIIPEQDINYNDMRPRSDYIHW
ncbi:hypothetical protein CEXT_417691 [Caerostris extrusa]|uniref:Uncharacterized protein n=1 Tax=Caerostris extrusa TaxID=172846 RepID=A0AAV4WWF6_CAEEX|nr:hypothetical protein CEXT_417691 [Caerostris extrusa]